MDLLLEIHLGEPLETESTNLYIMNLQLENQLIQGNQVTFGSPLWRFITLLNEIFYFILVTWITKWRTNCFKGIKQLRFSTVEIHYFTNEIFYFMLVSWISKWRTNCFKGIKTIQFQIMDLQMENQLLQGNLAVSGSPCWRSNTIVNNILYFILVSWISKWRTNCFRGTKKLQFCIMDLQMVNQLLQGNQAALGSP